MVWRGAKRIGVISKAGGAGGLVDMLWVTMDGRYRPKTTSLAKLNPAYFVSRIEFCSTNSGMTNF